MPDELANLAARIPLDPAQFIGIPIALIGAIFLSFGAQFQHRGVNKVEKHNVAGGGPGLSINQFLRLLKRPSWVVGTLLLGMAVVLQLISLYFSPLIVVQPLGAFALVTTAILNSRISRVKLNKRSIAAVLVCVIGVGLFVTIASFNARDRPVTEVDLITILIILGVVFTAFVLAFVFLRRRFKALFYIVGAGALYGFVVTLAKVVISRLSVREFDWLTAVCVVALIAAAALGGMFVQNAYSSGPPDLVIAGLTVIDPLVAVSIGIVVLGEAAQAPLWAVVGFIVCGIIAIWGVFLLARYHPQTQLPATSVTARD